MLRFITVLVLSVLSIPTNADSLRVPQDYKSIQAAVDHAKPGDTVLVSAGTYRERVQLKPEITLRSVGDETTGEKGLKRAESVILDGSGENGNQPGIVLAEGSTLDGITITNVGVYDEQTWKMHFDSHGEQLSDDDGSVRADGTIPAVSVDGVNCRVINNIVHHNGDAGIAVIGRQDRRVTPLIAKNACFRNLGSGIGVAELAEPIVQGNTCTENLRAGIGCRNSSPLILDNTCYQNIRAGIGCREGARPTIRENSCFRNRRAGIGIRMNDTAPVVEHNECYENDMAGIGIRDGARPIIRSNKCYKNTMAGIGCDGSSPLIVGNECHENLMAGIGLQGNTVAAVQNNTCVENKLVAIGITQGSTATITGNRLMRTGGVPPIIAVKDGSDASIYNNDFLGGGVAALLVQGTTIARGNRFSGAGEKQSNAVWVWEGSSATIVSNSFDGYRAAINASGSEILAIKNTIRDFRGPAIVVRNGSMPAHIADNTAFSKDQASVVVAVQGPEGVVANNTLKLLRNSDGQE